MMTSVNATKRGTVTKTLTVRMDVPKRAHRRWFGPVPCGPMQLLLTLAALTYVLHAATALAAHYLSGVAA